MKRTLPLLLLLVGAAACESRREPDPVYRSDEQLSRIGNDSVRAVVSGTPPALTQPDSAGVGDARSFRLAPLNNSGLGASAIVAPQGNGTQVIINIAEGPPNARIEANVLGGTCAAPGDTVAHIGPIVTDAQGTAESRSGLDVAPGNILDGNHVLQINNRTATALVNAACERIPPSREVRSMPVTP